MTANKDNVTLRSDKDSPLTQAEVDQNFQETKNTIDDLDRRVVVRETRSDLKTSNAKIGWYIQLSGISANDDGQGGLYEVVAGGTGTADDVSLIDLDNGNQAKLVAGRVDTGSGTNQTVSEALDQRVASVDTIADLQALPTGGLVNGQGLKITTTERAGDFVVRVGDFSAEVTNDPESGVWVPFDSDPTGSSIAAMRLYNRWEPVPVSWWGALGGAVDDTVAFQAAIDYGVDVLTTSEAVHVYSSLDINSPISIECPFWSTLKPTGTITVRSDDVRFKINAEITQASDLILCDTNISNLTLEHCNIKKTAAVNSIAVKVLGVSVKGLRLRHNEFVVDPSVAASAIGEAVYYAMAETTDSWFDVYDNTFDGWDESFKALASTEPSGFTSNEVESKFNCNRVHNATFRAASFYHTENSVVLHNEFDGNFNGVWVDNVKRFDHNSVTNCTSTPSLSPVSKPVDLTDSTEATNFRDYNSWHGAVLLYNKAGSFRGNTIKSNSWDGVVISVDGYRDIDSGLYDNDIMGNGRHGIFISPMPRGDSWGGNRVIYVPKIIGGIIADNAGHAIKLDTRYVESDLTIVNERIYGPVPVMGVQFAENGSASYTDEDNVSASMLVWYVGTNSCNLLFYNNLYITGLQGGDKVTVNGVYIIDDPINGSPSGAQFYSVSGNYLIDLNGVAIRNTLRYGERSFVNNQVNDLATSIDANTALGGFFINRNNSDKSGATN